MSDRHIYDFNSWLGLTKNSDGDLELEARAPEHQIGTGWVHFAVLTAMGEIAAAQAVGGSVVPASVNAHFLRPAPIGKLVARGKVLSRGRKLRTAEGEIYAGEKLVAKVTVQFAVMA